MEKLKPCPFCGEKPIIRPWHGGAPTKKMILCDNGNCPVQPQVTGEIKKEAIDNWDMRDNGVCNWKKEDTFWRSECGHLIPVDLQSEAHKKDETVAFEYCPWCGKNCIVN